LLRFRLVFDLDEVIRATKNGAQSDEKQIPQRVPATAGEARVGQSSEGGGQGHAGTIRQGNPLFMPPQNKQTEANS
jgi:hypothetical protein